MMKKDSLTIIFISALIFNFILGSTGWAAEPSMADYECTPIFSINAVQPNILIILDSSKSMNQPAYGTWSKDGDIMRDLPYAGEPYNGRIGRLIKASANDAQETSTGVTLDDNALTLGVYGTESVTAGLRFTDIEIPRGETIEYAYIQFKAAYSDTDAATYKIVGEAADDSAAFSAIAGDISGRPATTASVSGTAAAWTIGTTYETTVTNIVQEIVSRTNWESGNAMSFIITGTGQRRPYTYDADPANAPMLYIKYSNAEGVKYYGYFNPEYFYTNKTGNLFEHIYKKVDYNETGGYWNVTDLSGTATTLTDATIVSQGLWDGNWLNWMSMRRIDVLRKVLMGGLQTARAGGGNQVNYGETPSSGSVRDYIRYFDSSAGSAVSPYDGAYYYGMEGSDLHVDTDSDPFTTSIPSVGIIIQKEIAYDPDDFDSTTKNLAGILDRVGVKARWGLEWFKLGTGNKGSGGYIKEVMQEITSTDFITQIQNESCDQMTPLAEAYYVAVQYFKQENPESGLQYATGVVPHANIGDDPYYNGTQYVECAKSFVLMLTDGMSTVDAMVPESLRDFDGDGKENYTTTACADDRNVTCDYDEGGTDYLDDIALYARTTDLRSATVGKSELDGEQSLMLYTVLAFEEDINAVNLLSDASKNGGFIDRNGNDRPDLDEEWDLNSDGIPDTFYMASDGYRLQKELLKAINDILKRAASGTAVSVLATSGEGEGTLVQAYFRPSVPSGLEEVNWVGYLQSLWVDDHGNLREDTNKNKILNIAEDNIVSYYLDPATNETKVKLWYVSGGNEYPDTSTVTQDETREMDEITPIWEGGKMLAERVPGDRSIFTYIDQDDDDVVDETTYNNLDTSGEMVAFDSTAASVITPYLGVASTTWNYLGSTKADRVANLISYIRGTDITGLRKRTMEDGTVWKLGDIVHSTPVSVSKPTDNYHIIYSDEDFGTYYDTYKDRETVVYVGSNDGMLHAFTAGKYNESTRKFEEVNSTSIGSEIWAYIPQALLPHLKWLPDISYSHVYYVDLKPKIFDAQYDYDDDPNTPDEWRTILLLGLNLGGGKINVTDDFDYNSATADTTRVFASSYTCMDVTDPRNPKVLWERSYPDLELTTSYPSPVRVKDKWFVVFGSGPNAKPTYNCNCTSANYGHIFIVDLETGNPYEASTGSGWLYETAENKAFMSAPVSVDKDLNFNVDAIYIGETYDSSIWLGKVYKIPVPWIDPGTGLYDGTNVNNYSDNPNDWAPYIYSFFDSPGPITSSAALSVDALDNLWIYVGTGRYLSNSDKSDTNQQYIFGIKDPFYNKNYDTTGGYYHDYSVSASYELGTSNLLFSDPFYVNKDTYEVLKDTSLPLDGDPDESIGGWHDLLDLSRAEDGWYRSLSIAYERVITKFSILGGIVFAPTFVPTDDICGFGGDSYLYGVYYETGTSYYKPIFCEGERTTYYSATSSEITTISDKTSIGSGMTSNIGVHVGKEGAKGFIQTSTGTIEEVDIDPGSPIKSGLMSWIEK